MHSTESGGICTLTCTYACFVHVSYFAIQLSLGSQPAGYPSTRPSTSPHRTTTTFTWEDRGVLAEKGVFLENDFPDLFDDEDDEDD